MTYFCTSCWHPELAKMKQRGFYRCANCGAVFEELGDMLVRVNAANTKEQLDALNEARENEVKE